MPVTMETRHPECPDVHMGVCPKCRRLYTRDGDEAIPETPIHAERLGSVETGRVQDDATTPCETSDASPATDAARAAKYRARKKATDPHWLTKEANRKRDARKK